MPPEMSSLVRCVLSDDVEKAAYAVYEACRDGLELELRSRKGRMHWLPCHLGFDGRFWDPSSRQELLHELVAHALEKMPVLRRAASDGQLGRGYFVQMIRAFLVDRQRRLDPVRTTGYRRLVHSVKLQIEAGVLCAHPPGGALSKRTELRFCGPSLGMSADAAQLSCAIDSFSHASRLLQQFTKLGHKQTRELAQLWPHLRSCQIHSFLLGDLLDALVPRRSGEVPLDPDVPVASASSEGFRFDAAIGAIRAKALPASTEALLLEAIKRAYDSVCQTGAVNWSSVAESMGLDRRRVHELKQRLAQVLASAVPEMFVE